MKTVQEQLQEIGNDLKINDLTSLYNKHTKLSPDLYDELIDFGETLPIDNVDIVCKIMDEWVSKQDVYLSRLRQSTDDPFFIAVAFGQRGVTLKEFKYVMSGKRPSSYLNHPAFYYFHIINEEAHDYFISTTADEEKTITELYLERVKKFVQLEIPLLQSFFFRI